MSPRPRGTGGRILGVMVAVLVLGAGLESYASHYRLAASGIVSQAELSALKAAGVGTTAELLERAAPRRARQRLVRTTKLSTARVTELATQCDLLRVRGVGPNMMRLLQASGIRHSGLLAKAAPARLREKMRAANKLYRIAAVLPDVTTVDDWIRQAQRMPRLLEGVR